MRVLHLISSQLARKVVMFACDGASVLQGKHNGATTPLMTIWPFLHTMHGHAHLFDVAAAILKQCLASTGAAATSASPYFFYSHSNERSVALREVRVAC